MKKLIYKVYTGIDCIKIVYSLGKYRGNRQRHSHTTLSHVAKETATSLPADSPVLAMFKDAALKLNDRQDRHERLVKLSRDITIESKRIIFLLHSVITYVYND